MDNQLMKSALLDINQSFKEADIAKRAQEKKIPYVNLTNFTINPDFLKLIPFDICQTAQVVCFLKTGSKIKIATIDESHPAITEIINRWKNDNLETVVHLASEESLKHALEEYAVLLKTSVTEVHNVVDETNLDSYQNIITNLQELNDKAKLMSSPELLNTINVAAIQTRASDVHIQPDEKRIVVRFRIDGVLRDIFELTRKNFLELSTEIKYRSHIILNVTTRPQDGKYRFIINERRVDVRVSTIPTPYGESFVLRILDKRDKMKTLAEIGFAGDNLAKINKSIHKPNGIILLTGPTGSGKTTTLYSILDSLNSPETKIITLEDPIEYNLPGITQSQVSEKEHYQFADGLRAILRHDPDIIMVGEIRDQETAEIAAQSSLTGHLVLSTLHTNSALESINRLLNIGLEAYMIAPSLEAVIAQRLVRLLCHQCKQKRPVSTEEEAFFNSIRDKLPPTHPFLKTALPSHVYDPGHCAECSETGYLGRTIISEVIVFDATLREMVLQKATHEQMFQYLRTAQTYTTMLEDGLVKVFSGETTLHEVQRLAD